MQMPKLNGYEACKRIKAEATLQHIPVMFLSALGAAVDVRVGLAVGAIVYLLKPFAVNELAYRVSEILGRDPVPADDTALRRMVAENGK